MYKIIAIIGEAGSGKDTVLKSVMKNNHTAHEIVSCTTRPPRENEIDGINYIFMTGEAFGEKVLRGEMLEASYFNEWFYGTSFESLRSDCVNIGVFNPEGIEALMANKEIDLIVYYVRAKDKTRLLRQLNRESDPDVFEIIRRFKADWIDFENLNFHYNELSNENEEDLDFNTKVIGAAIERFARKNG